MGISHSNLVKAVLAKPDIHLKWETAYRTPENEKFYDRAFDYILRAVNPPHKSIFLDVGCGVCAHSIRLAKHAFVVHAIDCSEDILKEARLNVKLKGLESKISIHCGDLLSLPFRDETFSYVLCWGVLMHVPDVEGAMGELSRVLKPDGILIVSEANMYSLQSRVFRNVRRLLKKEKADLKTTPAGLEHWSSSSDGELVTREANVRWLIETFNGKGLRVRKCISGQFTEAYTRVSSRMVRNIIHAFNKLWFTWIRSPYAAAGNIMIFQKLSEASSGRRLGTGHLHVPDSEA